MPEEEAFCVLVKLMHNYKLRELFKPSMADLGLCFYQLEKLVEVIKSCHGNKQCHYVHHFVCVCVCVCVRAHVCARVIV